jgi:hypothetical protein
VARRRTFKSFGDFALRGVDMMRDDAAELDVRYHRGLHQRLGELARSLTPVDEGEMKAKWGSVIGRSGARRPLGSGLGSIKPGDVSKVVNSAPHASVIDAGRSVAHPKGSKFAPRGVTKPALSKLEAEKDGIRAKVIARVERG